MIVDLSNVSTDALLKELEHRENNPHWFIRSMVADGIDCDNDAFDAATGWIDAPRSHED